MSSTLNYQVAGFSHTGKRPSNEDRYCVLSGTDNKSVLVIVTDGMGGHAGGELAASTVVDCAADIWQTRSAQDSPETFLSALAADCHRAVVDAGKSTGQGPRATLAALYLYTVENKVKAVSMHVGDSRIMQFSHAGLVEQSVDHSLAQLKVLQGKIRQEDVAKDPDQNKVINCIGGEENPEPEITWWDIDKGDRFVICSDGFWELFTPEDMLSLYMTAESGGSDGETLEELVEQQFLSRLQKSEAQDNTTVVMLSEIGCAPVTTGVAASSGNKSESMSSSAANRATDASAAAGIRKPDNRAIALAAGAMALLVLAFVMWLRGADESPARSDGAVDTVQTDGSDAPGENRPSGESRGEPVPDTPVPETSPASRGERGGTPDGAALEEIDQEISIVVASDQELIEAVLELLRNSSGLGSDDALVLSRESEIEGNRVVRLSQEYQGIPVFGGEVIVIQTDDTLTHLSGETGAGIELDVEPALSFQQAVAQAATATSESMTADGEGQLVIFDSAGTYHLAWIGLVRLEDSPVRMVLDADDARILARFPVQIEGNPQ